MDDDILELKALVEKQGEAVKSYVDGIRDDMANERKERENLEIRLQRMGFKGTVLGNADGGPEHKAINDFVRNGAPDWAQEAEVKTLAVGSDQDGGYVVLPVMSQSMTTRLHDMSPMRRLARVESIATGDAFEEPDDRDEAAAAWVAERESRPATNTPQLGMIRIGLHEIYAMPVATQRLLDDASRDMGAWLESKITDKFGRTEGAAFVTGDGVGKPRGFLDYTTSTSADASRPRGQLQYVPSGGASDFASSNPADALKSILWTLRAPYRSGAVWLMNSNTASKIDKFKDANGDYLWRDGMTAGAPPSLLGYPVEFDEGMPDVGTDTYPIAFGNFQLGYCIVDRPGVKMLRDPYTNRPHVNFYAYKRVGGGIANDDAIKLLKIAVS